MRTFLTHFLFFGGVEALGLAAAVRLKKIVPEVAGRVEPISVGELIAALAIATVVFLLLAKFRHKLFRGRVLRVLFWFTLALGLLVFWESFLPSIPALILTLALLWWRGQKPSLLNHNILVGLASAGVGAVLGLGLTPGQVVMLLAILALYDIVAVYVTKHMVTIAKAMIEEKTVIGLILPEPGQTFRAHPVQALPGQGFMILGAGDLVFPLVMVAAVGVADISRGLIVLAFALAGFALMQFIFRSQRLRRPMPALPPLALAVIVGYLVSGRLFV